MTASTVRRRYGKRPRICSPATALIWRRSSPNLGRRLQTDDNRARPRRATLPAWSLPSAVLPPRERDLDLTLFIVTQHCDGDGVACRLSEQRLGERRLALNPLVANAEDDVVPLDSRLLRGTSLDSRQNIGAIVDREIVLGGQVGRDRLVLDPDVWIGHVPVLDELAGDIGDVVRRNGEE